jgi:uncharacterized lipoprotein NlpE involved in copper resistance
MKKLILVAVALCSLIIVGCQPASDGMSGQYKTTSKDRWEDATVHVNWVRDQTALNEKCQSFAAKYTGNHPAQFGACTLVVSDGKSSTGTCEIYAIRPRSFNDNANLRVLGHEFWHCLGATHD